MVPSSTGGPDHHIEGAQQTRPILCADRSEIAHNRGRTLVDELLDVLGVADQGRDAVACCDELRDAVARDVTACAKDKNMLLFHGAHPTPLF